MEGEGAGGARGRYKGEETSRVKLRFCVKRPMKAQGVVCAGVLFLVWRYTVNTSFLFFFLCVFVSIRACMCL